MHNSTAHARVSHSLARFFNPHAATIDLISFSAIILVYLMSYCYAANKCCTPLVICNVVFSLRDNASAVSNNIMENERSRYSLPVYARYRYISIRWFVSTAAIRFDQIYPHVRERVQYKMNNLVSIVCDNNIELG